MSKDLQGLTLQDYDMPAKNSVKEYESGGYYHIYNRGVEKRLIFIDEGDYKNFLGIMKMYLTLPTMQGLTLQVDGAEKSMAPSKKPNNFAAEISLICYCLMPNHFHLMLKQNSDRSMASFLQTIMTKYVVYFKFCYEDGRTTNCRIRSRFTRTRNSQGNLENLTQCS